MKPILAPLMLFCLWAPLSASQIYRPQKYACYKAHGILPETLRFLVRKHGRQLFAGVEAGLAVPREAIDQDRIFAEVEVITRLVNQRRPFSHVVRQMGFVTGILAVHTNPALDCGLAARRGFDYYLDKKLGRFLFVFDGYGAMGSDRLALRGELARITANNANYRRLLDLKYSEAGGNYRHHFDERSAVFGICSIYFSNLARLSAHLWYDAWSSAHGDLTIMPFRADITTAKGYRP